MTCRRSGGAQRRRVGASIATRFAALLFCSATGGACVGPGRLGPPSAPRAVDNLPEWTLQDCVEREGAFLVVGMGQGASPSEAGRSAVLAARRSAVLCVFGASISTELETLETNDSSSGSERLRESVAVESVDWQGFELVPGHNLTLQDDRGFRVHAQYRWSRQEADVARSRARQLADAAERARALKAQVTAQGHVIEAQRQRLAELDAQEKELTALKDRADAASKRIASLAQAQGSKNSSVAKVVANLYCGVTFGQVINALGKPDETRAGACTFSSKVSKMRWAEYVLMSGVIECNESEDDARVDGYHDKFGEGSYRKLCR